MPVRPPSPLNVQNVRRRESGVMECDVQATAKCKDGYVETVDTAFLSLT